MQESKERERGLDDLINKLLEYHGANSIGRRIEDALPPLCRPRIMLAAAQSASKDDPYNDPSIVATALRYMFLIFTPQEVIVKCCSLRPLVDLHRDILGEAQFSYSEAETREVAEALLCVFNVPSPVGQQSLFIRSPSEAISEIVEIERAVMRSVDQSLTNAVSMQGGAITAWALVESVLKLSLSFFALHFNTQLPPKIFSRCKSALQKKAGGQIAGLFKELELIFEQGELNADKKRRGETIQSELSKISDDAARRKRRKKLLDQKAQEEEEKQRYAEDLRRDCRQYFGRDTPFQYVNTEHYKDWVRLWRNPFAHKPLEDITKGAKDSDKVLQSLNKAKNVIQDLRKSRAVPRIIAVMGECRDWHGNPVVWFTDRENIGPELPRRDLVEWMYASPGGHFVPFQQIAMITPEVDRKLREPLIEPVVYPIEDIITLFDVGGGQGAVNE